MNDITEIITSNFSELDKLLENYYIPISIVGKVYGNYSSKDKVERIRGLNTFRNFYNEKAGDYKSCYLLYQNNLERIGLERITSTFNNLCKTHSKTKIALCGHGKEQEFCYRHILKNFLAENNINVVNNEKVDMSLQKKLWKYDEYKTRGHFNLDDEIIGRKLQGSKWIVAKTMPKNPHSYTLRKDMGDDNLFLKIASHIRYFGKIEIFEGVAYRVFYHNGYKYWDHPCDLLNNNVDLINRAIVN
ncbi:hypothetical protein [Polaribacter glomeratus]|uniref:Uncharacterized protein n=1 Tax=Polaribacter glomeratus TaxID=102 RepID=A0A2S7WH19_9FLAO|nr:hypothetical protein [Polaribacter glomeratus]PQJ76552.1 hypothetical protein BTO16_11670 [Polaribacter glomeratus]TXD67613.1 hypothetical protein ESX12_03245 [Polaribacter glomeratus]